MVDFDFQRELEIYDRWLRDTYSPRLRQVVPLRWRKKHHSFTDMCFYMRINTDLPQVDSESKAQIFSDDLDKTYTDYLLKYVEDASVITSYQDASAREIPRLVQARIDSLTKANKRNFVRQCYSFTDTSFYDDDLETHTEDDKKKFYAESLQHFLAFDRERRKLQKEGGKGGHTSHVKPFLEELDDDLRPFHSTFQTEGEYGESEQLLAPIDEHTGDMEIDGPEDLNGQITGQDIHPPVYSGDEDLEGEEEPMNIYDFRITLRLT